MLTENTVEIPVKASEMVGYKQTEMGWIPEDWEVVAIEEILDVDPENLRSSTSPDFEFKYISLENVDFGVLSGYSEVIFRNAPSRARRVLRKGDILVATVRPNLKSHYLFRANSNNFVCSTGFAVLRNSKALCNSKLIYSHFFGSILNTQIENLISGSNYPAISSRDVKKLRVPIPRTTKEQTAIATALSDMDGYISSLEKLIAKKCLMKLGAMQELLTPKEDWEVRKLGEIADPNIKWSFTGGPFGSNLKSSDYTEDGVRVIQLQNIGDGQFFNDSEIFTSVEKANDLLSCNIYPGDIILSKMGDPVARACIIPDFHKRYLMCSDGIRLAVNRKYFDPYFIYLTINNKKFRSLAENNSTGSTRKRIGLSQLRNLELKVPSLKEQQWVSSLVLQMNKEISSLENKNTKAKQIKQGMMQELLTGRIRLV